MLDLRESADATYSMALESAKRAEITIAKQQSFSLSPAGTKTAMVESDRIILVDELLHVSEQPNT